MKTATQKTMRIETENFVFYANSTKVVLIRNQIIGKTEEELKNLIKEATSSKRLVLKEIKKDEMKCFLKMHYDYISKNEVVRKMKCLYGPILSMGEIAVAYDEIEQYKD